MVNFICKECGSTKLAYQKYVKSVVPVDLKEDGNLYYSHSSFNEDDYLGVSYGYCCSDCGHLIEHCGCHVDNENALLIYLTMDAQIQQQQELDYEAYIDSQTVAEEQREKEQAFYYQEVAETDMLMEL